MDLTSPSELLRAVRAERGWSQAEAGRALAALAAERHGVGPSATSLKTQLSRWENGHTAPDPQHRGMLSELYGRSEEELGLAGRSEPDVPGGPERLRVEVASAAAVDGEVIALWNEQLRLARALDRRLGTVGASSTAEALVAQLERTLLHSFHRERRAQLALLLGWATALSGVHALDRGEPDIAFARMDRARWVARDAEAEDLQARAVAGQASALVDAGEAAAALDLLAAGPPGSPRARAGWRPRAASFRPRSSIRRPCAGRSPTWPRPAARSPSTKVGSSHQRNPRSWTAIESFRPWRSSWRSFTAGMAMRSQSSGSRTPPASSSTPSPPNPGRYGNVPSCMPTWRWRRHARDGLRSRRLTPARRERSASGRARGASSIGCGGPGDDADHGSSGVPWISDHGLPHGAEMAAFRFVPHRARPPRSALPGATCLAKPVNREPRHTADCRGWSCLPPGASRAGQADLQRRPTESMSSSAAEYGSSSPVATRFASSASVSPLGALRCAP